MKLSLTSVRKDWFVKCSGFLIEYQIYPNTLRRAPPSTTRPISRNERTDSKKLSKSCETNVQHNSRKAVAQCGNSEANGVTRGLSQGENLAEEGPQVTVRRPTSQHSKKLRNYSEPERGCLH